MTVSFFDVSTPISDLQASWDSRPDIFNDLGSGTVFGVQVVRSADTVLSFPLNANAIAALNSAIGGKFAIGGAITSETGGLFLGTIGTEIKELVITTAATPRPVTLFWQQDGTDVAAVWYMGGSDGTTLLSAKYLSDPQPGWRIVAVGDLNGDGHPDLIWQQDGTNVPGVWYMGGADGSTRLNAKFLSDPQPGWRIVAVGDLNGDGHPDLIWQQDGTNLPGVWYMGGADGSTLLSTKYLSGPQPGWRIVGLE